MLKAVRLIILFVVLAIALMAMQQTRDPLPKYDARIGPPIAASETWGYQLQAARPGLIDPAIDLLVVDYSRDGRHETAFRPADVDAFRKRPNGANRIVLAYLSVGEAESYRFYWSKLWQGGKSPLAPSWLATENSEWKGNYKVRFWDKGWQDLLLHTDRTLLDRVFEKFLPGRKSYLDHIIDAGFDGIYLDRVDAFDEWKAERPAAEADMVTLVARISAHAKSRKPGFLIVPQNGEELLRNGVYRSSIDAVAKEDLFFGIDHGEQENEASVVNRTILLLNRAKTDNRPVFVVEYLDNSDKRKAAAARATSLGYRIHFANRELNQPPVPFTAATK